MTFTSGGNSESATEFDNETNKIWMFTPQKNWTWEEIEFKLKEPTHAHTMSVIEECPKGTIF